MSSVFYTIAAVLLATACTAETPALRGGAALDLAEALPQKGGGRLPKKEHKWMCVKGGKLEGSAFTKLGTCKAACGKKGGKCLSAMTGSGWSKWSRWSKCPTTCTHSDRPPTVSRSRFCEFKAGLYANVIACPGAKTELMKCKKWAGQCSFQVLRATWGYHNCGKRGSHQLKRVEAACADNVMGCRFSWKVGDLGDPAPGCPKWFLTEYRCCSTRGFLKECKKRFAEFPPKWPEEDGHVTMHCGPKKKKKKRNSA